MDDTDLVAFTRKLLELQSHTRETSDVPHFIAETLYRHGAQPHILEREGVRNIVACTTDEYCVVLNGHWDTVLPNEEFAKALLPTRLEDNNLYGLGACDMKSGVAAQCAAFLRCLQQEIPGILLCVVGDEEVGGANGTGLLVEEGYYAPYAVLGEPTNLRLSLGQKGGMRVTATTRGRLAHGAYPHRGENAILKMTGFIERLLQSYPLPPPGTSDSDVFTRTTASVGQIEGGEAPNVVPDRCRATIDIRIPPHTSIDEIQSNLQQIGEETGAEVSYDFLGYGWQLDKASRIYEVSKTAVEEVTGRPPEFVQKMGTNDGKYYAYKGAQITNIGPGHNKLSHTAHERVPLQQLTQARDIYVRIAQLLTSGAKELPG